MHHTQQTHSPNYGQYDPYAAGPPRPEPIGIQVSQEIDEDEETRKNWQLDDEVEVFSGGNVEYRNDGNLAGRWTVHHKSASATSCVLRISQHYHYLKPHSEIITNGEALRTLYAIHTNHRRPIELVVIPSDNISLIPTTYPIHYNTNYTVIPGLQQPYQYQYRGMNQNQKRQLIHSIAIDTINQSSRYVTVQNPITRHPYWEWDNPVYRKCSRLNSSHRYI
eukprot:1126566_1